MAARHNKPFRHVSHLERKHSSDLPTATIAKATTKLLENPKAILRMYAGLILLRDTRN